MMLTAFPMFVLAAAAQITFVTPTTAPPSNAPKTGNSNDKVICEREEEIGSRLGGKKVCKTAAEWQEERRLQRQDIERIQQTTNQSPSG